MADKVIKLHDNSKNDLVPHKAKQVSNSLTISSTGGANPGTTYNGSSAVTISPKSIGAVSDFNSCFPYSVTSETELTHVNVSWPGCSSSYSTDTLLVKCENETIKGILFTIDRVDKVLTNKINDTSGALNLMSYKLTDVTAGGSEKWTVGATDTQGIIKSTNVDLLHFRNDGTYTILDSSNYNSYALPLSGGTMTGTIYSQKIIPKAGATYDLGDVNHHFEHIYGRYFTAQPGYNVRIGAIASGTTAFKEVISVAATGDKVGINNTSPSYTLDVNGTVKVGTKIITNLIETSDGKALLSWINNNNSDVAGASSNTWVVGKHDSPGVIRSSTNLVHYKLGTNYPIFDTNNYITLTTAAGVSAMLNKLDVGSDTPQSTDYYICQYTGGGTSHTNYYRRPISALLTYIQNNISYAPKLKTRRTIWGLTFNGEQNVSGNIKYSWGFTDALTTHTNAPSGFTLTGGNTLAKLCSVWISANRWSSFEFILRGNHGSTPWSARYILETTTGAYQNDGTFALKCVYSDTLISSPMYFVDEGIVLKENSGYSNDCHKITLYKGLDGTWGLLYIVPINSQEVFNYLKYTYDSTDTVNYGILFSSNTVTGKVALVNYDKMQWRGVVDASRVTSGILSSERIPSPTFSETVYNPNNGLAKVTGSVVEIGQYIDFHTDNKVPGTDNYYYRDYNTRIAASDGYYSSGTNVGANIIYLGTGTGTVGLMELNSGLWGLKTPDGSGSNWIRTTTPGIIPYSADASNGKSSLGTYSWPFASAYIKTINTTSVNTTNVTATGTIKSRQVFVNTYNRVLTSPGDMVNWKCILVFKGDTSLFTSINFDLIPAELQETLSEEYSITFAKRNAATCSFHGSVKGVSATNRQFLARVYQNGDTTAETVEIWMSCTPEKWDIGMNIVINSMCGIEKYFICPTYTNTTTDPSDTTNALTSGVIKTYPSLWNLLDNWVTDNSWNNTTGGLVPISWSLGYSGLNFRYLD